MRRALPAALALLALAACGSGEPAPAPEKPAGTDAAPAPAPVVATEGTLAVTVEAAAASVELSDAVVLRVTVENRGDARTRVNVPRIDRHCATVRVRIGESDPYVLERLYADIVPPGRLEWKVPEARELGPGESLSEELRFTAAQVGEHHVTVTYRPSVQSDPITPDPVKVTVAAKGGDTRLGAEMVTSKGAVTVALRPDLAPNTVESFASLARAGFFDGLTFHRIVAGFMAQGGDPEGTGGGGPGYFLPLEANRTLLHDRGVLSMARTNLPDTAGSQFFLMFTRYPSLDPGSQGPGYTTFGEVVEGDATLTALESVETRIPEQVREQLDARGIPAEQIDMLVRAGRIEKSAPVEKVTIESVRLTTLD